MSSAMRAHYDHQLRELRESMLLLGSLTEKAVRRSVQALEERSVALADAVIEEDRAIDDWARRLEERALLLIVTQQPLAGDLRLIAAVLFIASELERIGDYAEGIAKLARTAVAEPPIKPLVDVPRMATIAASMLRGSLEAFLARDLGACQAIWQRDDELDALYRRVYRELLEIMLRDSTAIARATHLLWVAHNLERIGDRVTNICERAAFVITGDPQALPLREGAGGAPPAR